MAPVISRTVVYGVKVDLKQFCEKIKLFEKYNEKRKDKISEEDFYDDINAVLEELVVKNNDYSKEDYGTNIRNLKFFKLDSCTQSSENVIVIGYEIYSFKFPTYSIGDIVDSRIENCLNDLKNVIINDININCFDLNFLRKTIEKDFNITPLPSIYEIDNDCRCCT